LVVFLDGEGRPRVSVQWNQLGAWTIAELTSSVLQYCSALNSRIEQVLDVRVSFRSLLNYHQQITKFKQHAVMRQHAVSEGYEKMQK
jgi:hypothetical protein